MKSWVKTFKLIDCAYPMFTVIEKAG